MLKNRIIPCLDIKNGRTVKGINFEGIRDAGDPVTLGKLYSDSGADELVFLDITATNERRNTLVDLVLRIAENISIPFTVGGGINSVQDVEKVILAGADKVSINSAAVRRPALISEIAAQFGSQCVVVAIDIKKTPQGWKVFTHGGTVETPLFAVEWAKQAVEMGAGELLITSMDQDGTKAGFACEITDEIARATGVPVIASGGAGTISDFVTLFEQTVVTGALAASIFHFGEISIPELKSALKMNAIPIR